MFQTVVDFFYRVFSPLIPAEWTNRNKRIREDEGLCFDEDPPMKKLRMNFNTDSEDSSYFSNPYISKTREKCSQTTEVIDLESPTYATISLIDNESSVSDDKENATTSGLSPFKSKYSPKNKYKPPAHCRSPFKTKIKHVSNRRESDDVQYVGSYSKDSLDQVYPNSLRGSVMRRITPLKTKPYSVRTERIMNLASKTPPESMNSSVLYDMRSRMKYGQLLGKVLKNPDLFSCSSSPRTLASQSRVIDLTESEPSTSKSFSRSRGESSKVSSTFIDLTKPSMEVKKPEIIDLDPDISVIPSSKVAPHRRFVSPVNSLSSKLKYVSAFQTDFVSDLVSEIENFKKDFVREQKALTEELSSLDPLRKAFEKSLEDRIKRHLKITTIDLDIEEEEEKEPVKPELTEQMIKTVMYAWDISKPKSQVLANNFNYQIKRADLLTLSGLNWLNDEVINFYMELITARGKEENFPSVHTFNTFFYPKLEKDGYSSLRRWTRKVDIFSYDIIIVPVHLRVHWCLAVIDFKMKTITYFDSMGHANDLCVNLLLKYLSEEHMDKKKEAYVTKSWKLTCTKETVPQQMNGSDCGVFACTFAEYATRRSKYNFSQQDMPYFRKKMTYEIISSKLLPWN